MVSDQLCKIGGMNLNREQFLKAVEQGKALLEELQADYSELKLKPVFSRFGPRSGQCDLTTDLRKIVMTFPEMLAGNIGREKAQKSQKGKELRNLLFEIRAVEKGGDKEKISKLWKQANEIERRLLDSELKLYCGDVLIEFRPGVLKYESLRSLQQDPRLPAELNEVGNVRVVAGSLSDLCAKEDI